MNTKAGCGRLDLSAFQGAAARPAWPTGSDDAAAAEVKTWRPVELDRPDLFSQFEPRPN